VTRLGLALAGLTAAALLAGCGGNDDGGDASGGRPSGGSSSGAGSASGSDFAGQSGQQIADAAKADMAALSSLRVAGTVTTGGSEVAIDLQMDGDGNCTGSLGTSQGRVQLLGADGRTWMKPDAAFWRGMAGAQADRVMQLVGDKWVVVPSTEQSFSQFCDADQLIKELVSDEGSDTTYTKTGSSTVDGRDVVEVASKDTGGQSSTGYVLVDDPHYLVKVEQVGGKEPGSVTFSDFDADVRTEAPAEADTVDLSKLAG
jgi:hypothetical protein